MDDCIFCKIIKGQIPCYKIYEDEHTLAFLDIANDLFGHTLVIPKKHCANTLNCDNLTINRTMAAVKKIAEHYIGLGFDGINIMNANGAAAEQSIMHLHFHIFPRKNNDGLVLHAIKLPKNNFTLEEQAEKLRMTNDK